MEQIDSWRVEGLPTDIDVMDIFRKCPEDTRLLIIKGEVYTIVALKRSFLLVANSVDIYPSHDTLRLCDGGECGFASKEITMNCTGYFTSYNGKETTELKDWFVGVLQTDVAERDMAKFTGWLEAVDAKLATPVLVVVEAY